MDPRLQPSFTGTSAFGGSASSVQVGLLTQPLPTGASAFGGSASGMPARLQAQPSFTGASAFGGSIPSLKAGPQMMPPPGSSAFGGSVPRLSDPRSHPVPAGSTAFGSSVSGPHKAFQPHPAVQPSVFSEFAARPQSATQTDASGISLASMGTSKLNYFGVFGKEICTEIIGATC